MTLIVGNAAKAEEAPKVSTFAPAEDLVGQVEEYVKELDSALASESEFKASQEIIGKQANTLAVLALTLGLHDTDNKYKASAGALIKAAQDLAAAKDFEAAKKTLAAVKSASGGAAPTKWEKTAVLDQLMKQVPSVHNKLKKNTKGSKFKSSGKASAGQSAVLAAIAQASIVDTSECKGDAQVKQWCDFCVKMRQASAEVNAAVHAKDAKTAEKAMEKLNQSCEDCHAVFKKEEKK